MINFRRLSIVLFMALLPACGDNGVTADAGRDLGRVEDAGHDLSVAVTCGCSRPSDCASGICCVQHNGNTHSAGSECAATVSDCDLRFYVDGFNTIACNTDSDCMGDFGDGGVMHYYCSYVDSTLCGARVCQFTE